MPSRLVGLSVVVTRPAAQAHAFTQRLQAAGAQPLLLPLLAITASADPQAARDLLANVAQYDVVLFISSNAVTFGLALVDVVPTLNQHCLVGAIGAKTAQALQAQGVVAQLVPAQGFTSEDLLALPALQQLVQQRVLIVRGHGGREVLASTLRERGAQVDYADVYQRVCPPIDAAALKQQHEQHGLGIIALTSGEGLQHLLAGLANPDWIKKVPLLVGSQRLAALAKQQGFQGAVVIADNPGDDAMFAALAHWAQETNQHDR